MGEFPPEEWTSLLRSPDLTPMFEEFIKTNCHKLNKKLISDQDLTPDEGLLLRQTKSLIGYLQPKPTGLCYFASNLSPIEIWRLEIKGRFYMSNFLICTTDFTLAQSVARTNVVFEVDCSQFNEYAVQLSNFSVLISLYNVYEWQGYRTEMDPETGRTFNVVRLRLLNYHHQNCDDKLCFVPRLNASLINLPLTSLDDHTKRKFLDRSLQGDQLHASVLELYNLFPLVKSEHEKSPAVQPVGRPNNLSKIDDNDDDRKLISLLLKAEEASISFAEHSNFFKKLKELTWA